MQTNGKVLPILSLQGKDNFTPSGMVTVTNLTTLNVGKELAQPELSYSAGVTWSHHFEKRVEVSYNC